MQECLIADKVTDAAMTEDRYCSQTACFGAAFQARVDNFVCSKKLALR